MSGIVGFSILNIVSKEMGKYIIRKPSKSGSRRKTLEMPENTEFFGNVVADWLQKCVASLLTE